MTEVLFVLWPNTTLDAVEQEIKERVAGRHIVSAQTTTLPTGNDVVTTIVVDDTQPIPKK